MSRDIKSILALFLLQFNIESGVSNKTTIKNARCDRADAIKSIRRDGNFLVYDTNLSSNGLTAPIQNIMLSGGTQGESRQFNLYQGLCFG